MGPWQHIWSHDLENFGSHLHLCLRLSAWMFEATHGHGDLQPSGICKLIWIRNSCCLSVSEIIIRAQHKNNRRGDEILSCACTTVTLSGAVMSCTCPSKCEETELFYS